MRANRLHIFPILFASLWIVVASAQQSATPAEPTASAAVTQDPGGIGNGIKVPRLIKLSGTLRTVSGTPLTGTHGLTLALYKEQKDGSPIWLESQNVDLDEQGRYTVLLGSTETEGLPVDLFRGDEPRWLGVQVQLPGYQEEARVLLVSVPYALKAVEAETLGGMPASSFVLTPEASQKVLAATGVQTAAAGSTLAARWLVAVPPVTCPCLWTAPATWATR